MMHLEYKKANYKGCHIDIQPAHRSDIPKLKEMVSNNLNIINPAVIFSEKMTLPFQSLTVWVTLRDGLESRSDEAKAYWKVMDSSG